MRNELIRMLQQHPFRAIVLRLSNGIIHEIRHPEMAIATPASIVVGRPASDAPAPAADDFIIVSLLHVVQIENEGQGSAAGANGPPVAERFGNQLHEHPS